MAAEEETGGRAAFVQEGLENVKTWGSYIWLEMEAFFKKAEKQVSLKTSMHAL